METKSHVSLSCPRPHDQSSCITLAHGGGGSVMHNLLNELFFKEFSDEHLAKKHDAAALTVAGSVLAFTTDSFVVQPLVFPGGDIGSLAVYGTVNDLAMRGAKPLYLSAGFILEEGLSTDLLRDLVQSMQRAAIAAGVAIVTGDTKVINRGNGDGLLINTAGIGVIEHNLAIEPGSIRPGDGVLVNGDLGRHGIAVMAKREGLEFETEIESDSAPVAEPVLEMLEQGVEIHCLRDLTRGGLSSAANEISTDAGLAIHLHESWIPVRDDVAGACELLGLDPLYVANEGRFIAFVSERDIGRALDVLKKHNRDCEPALIGHVEEKAPRVTLESKIGATRILDMLSGEQLPRIC